LVEGPETLPLNCA